MATPDEVRARLREVEGSLQPYGPPGATAVPGYGLTAQPVNLGPQSAEEPVYLGYGLYFVQSTQTYVKRSVDQWGDQLWVPATPSEITALEKTLGAGAGGGGGGAVTDPALERLQMDQAQQALEINASEEARAAEMQPYDIANVQSQIEDRRAAEEYNQKNLERQMLSDQFSRAQEIFNASYLADQLAQEKRKTATSLLASIVDNLVPPGMTSLPGIPGSTMPTVGQINWNQLGGPALSPETDQAVRYMQGMR